MIRFVNSLPQFKIRSAEQFKIAAAAHLYGDIADLWQSDQGGIISRLSGDMVLYGDFNTDELDLFLNMLSPRSVFCPSETAENILLKGYKKVSAEVVYLDFCPKSDCPLGDTLKSDEIYEMLKNGDFVLPEKQDFSVDFCHRLNRGALCYYAERQNGCAIALTEDGCTLINGIISLKKGFGTKALLSVMEKTGNRSVFAVAKHEVSPFYIKNGFEKLYDITYFVRG